MGAAHRLARHLARVRASAQGESEPSPLLYQQALRDVIGHCLYGVDVNPMAAELCRVSLWLEALEPGKPLSFLDHHIRVGNSLLGATPELITDGLLDEAFIAIEGDDQRACKVLMRRNRAERGGLGPLYAEQEAEMQARLLQSAAALEQLPDGRPEDLRTKERAFRRHEETDEYRHKKQVADLWCAAFVIKRCFSEPGRDSSAFGITQVDLDNLATGRPLPADLVGAAKSLAEQYQFFHWHFAFPEVFAQGGFDCVLGNPPWERVKLHEKEWFAGPRPEIANASNAADRKRRIRALKTDDPALHQQFLDDSRKAEGESHLLRHSGRYPLCGRGDINVYSVFAEGMRRLLNGRGRTGCVLPTGIATDDTTKFFFQDVVETKSLTSLFSFENEDFVFPQVHHATRFCLFTVGSGARALAGAAAFTFFARQIEHLRDPDRRFTLSAEDIAILNPNSRTCPIFRSRRDAELTKAIYHRVPVLIRKAQDGRLEENPWGIRFMRMFDMSNDSHRFHTREQLEADGWRLVGNIFRKNGEEYLPLYEAKMIHHFDHRWGTYHGQTKAQARQGKLLELDEDMHGDPQLLSLPRYWSPEREVASRLPASDNKPWLIGFRDITGATVVRTVIATMIPRAAVGNSLPLLLSTYREPSTLGCLAASLSSFACDFASRFKVGGTHLNFFIAAQIPVLPPASIVDSCSWCDTAGTLQDWLALRVLELTYTAWDVEPLAQECGWPGPPFR